MNRIITMTIRMNSLLCAICTCLALLCLLSADVQAANPGSWRLDADPAQVRPRNFRSDAQLKIAGGNQPTPETLKNLRQELGLPISTPLWIIDLRQESHGFLNGTAVSWHTERNAANRGLGASEVETRESHQLAAAMQTAVIAMPMGKADQLAIAAPFAGTISSWETERHFARSLGYGYERFAATDMSWPEPQAIDDFVAFYRSLPREHGWLFFHCQAGQGRTTTFMTLYELLEQPDHSAEEAAAHQKALGGVDLVQAGYLPQLQKFAAYAQENRNSGFITNWSIWLKNQNERKLVK